MPTLFTIYNLSTTSTLNNTDLFEIQRAGGGASYQINIGQLVTKVNSGISASYALLDVSQEWTAQQYFAATTLTDAATISWDLDANQVCTITLTDSRVMDAPTNMKAGGIYVLHVYQDVNGAHTITWDSSFIWNSDGEPVLTVAGYGHDIFTFICDGNNMFGSFNGGYSV